jgi:hypothetical protein
MSTEGTPSGVKSEGRATGKAAPQIEVIHGIQYAVIDAGFGNACRKCAFNRTACYDDKSFSCHSDSRPDGRDVIFIPAPRCNISGNNISGKLQNSPEVAVDGGPCHGNPVLALIVQRRERA